MKIKIYVLAMLLISTIFIAQKRIGINGKFQGDNAFIVEGFSDYNAISDYQKTYFIITNKTGDEVDIKFDVAITYTCNRVQKNAVNYHIKAYESITTNTWMKETMDKNCITTEVDKSLNTIIGINYLGLVTKNYSLDKRNIAKQFQNIIKNVQNYLSQKKYEVARIELDKANKLSLDAEDAQAVQDWYRKIAEKKEMDHIATSQDDGNSVKDNNKVQTEKKVSKSQSSTDDFWNDSASSKSTTNKQTTVDKKASDDKMAIDKIYKIMEDGERQRQETQRKMDNWSNNLNTTFYAQQSAKSAYSNSDYRKLKSN